MTIKFDLGHDLERWGVRIYRTVTGVTSDVGVPSTRLVGSDNGLASNEHQAIIWTSDDRVYWHIYASWWSHQMETFSALLALCAGNSSVTCEFPSQRAMTRSFDVFCAWTNDWVNNRDAGYLRGNRAHYGVTLMISMSQYTGGWSQTNMFKANQSTVRVCSVHTWHSLRWRHNKLDGVSDHQPHDCLLNRLFGHRSKKTSNSASLAFVRGIHRDRGIPRTKGQ